MGGSFETELERCCSGKSRKEGVADKIFEEDKVVKDEVEVVKQVEVVEELGYRVGGKQGEGAGRRWGGRRQASFLEYRNPFSSIRGFLALKDIQS